MDEMNYIKINRR